MSVDRLLSIAEALCGPDARHGVFEPLVADWHREWYDAEGTARRALVRLSGAAAFGWSLARCADFTWMMSRRQASTFAIVVFAFAVVGTLLAFQPLQYRWSGFGLELYWFPPSGNVLFYLPKALAYMAAASLVPALILATAAGWSARKLAAAVALTIVGMAIFEGWIGPLAMRLNDDLPANRVRLHATTSQLIALANGPDRRLATEARGELRQKVELLTMTVAFGSIGVALGRRRRTRRATTTRLAVAAWIATPFAYYALRHWGVYLVILASLPPAATRWIAPGVLTAVAGVMMIRKLSAAIVSEPPPSARA